MPSLYAFNLNHSALRPITYNTNTSWFAPIVRLFVSFLSAASNNIRSIDYKVSTRPHSKTATQSIMSAKCERRFLLVPFGKIVKLLFIAGRASFSFHHSLHHIQQGLYQHWNIFNTEWSAGTRHFSFQKCTSKQSAISLRSIDHQVSSRPHSKHSTKSIMRAKGGSQGKFDLIHFGKIVKLLAVAGNSFLFFNQSLY